MIGHNRARGTVVFDAGALALSKDLSAGEFFDDASYGWVHDRNGCERLAGAWVSDVHQEHGIVRGDGDTLFEALPVGALVRVLPNHSCITCAMYEGYHVVGPGGVDALDYWTRINGW